MELKKYIPESLYFPIFYYINAYLYKYGESIYFGYPASLIHIGLSDIINMALFNIFFIALYSIFFILQHRREKSLTDDLISYASVMLSIFIYYIINPEKLRDISFTLTILLSCLLILIIMSHSIKMHFKEKKFKFMVLFLLLSFLLSFLTGNASPSIAHPLTSTDNRIVINSNDKIIAISCEDNKKEIKLDDFHPYNLKTISILKRHFFTSFCNVE